MTGISITNTVSKLELLLTLRRAYGNTIPQQKYKNIENLSVTSENALTKELAITKIHNTIIALCIISKLIVLKGPEVLNKL
jgi:hypothetical protein